MMFFVGNLNFPGNWDNWDNLKFVNYFDAIIQWVNTHYYLVNLPNHFFFVFANLEWKIFTSMIKIERRGRINL